MFIRTLLSFFCIMLSFLLFSDIYHFRTLLEETKQKDLKLGFFGEITHMALHMAAAIGEAMSHQPSTRR